MAMVRRAELEEVQGKAEQEPQHAVALYRAAVDKDPTHGRALLLLGTALLSANNFSEAIDPLRAAMLSFEYALPRLPSLRSPVFPPSLSSHHPRCVARS